MSRANKGQTIDSNIANAVQILFIIPPVLMNTLKRNSGWRQNGSPARSAENEEMFS